MSPHPIDVRVAELTELLRERGEDREGLLWEALMVCHDCPHRMIDHDEVRYLCLECRCDQSERGLSSFADDRLTDYGRAIRDALAASRGQGEP